MVKNSDLRFMDYLSLQRFAPSTKEAYFGAVKGLADYYSTRQPDILSNEQIQDYLLYNIQVKKLAWASCNVLFCGLKKYYHDHLGRDNADFSIPPRTRSRKLPMLLSKEEVYQLLKVSSNLKHKALLATVYGSGLRVSEVVRLRPEHLDSNRMTIRVEQGKGRKDRYTVLSKYCLDLLRDHWRNAQPEGWLFFGRDKNRPMPINTAQRIFYNAKKATGLTKGRGIHTLRHCFASHALDAGVEIHIIKRWMGHSSLKTTYRYIHLCPDSLKTTDNPLDLMYAGRQS
jgi:site-specific recombinase XerD